LRLHHDRHIIRQLQQRKADRRHVRSLGREAEGPRDIIGFGEPKHDRAPLNTAFALQLKQASIVLRKFIGGSLDTAVKGAEFR